MEETSGNWYQVRYRGRIGWVSADYVCRGNLSRTPQSNSRNKTRLTMYTVIGVGPTVYKTKTVYVSATRPVSDIVGKLLKEGIVPERVGLIGYKVTVRNRIATINFITNRLGLGTLTTSEGEELYGSLNKTLTENSQLNIDKVVIFEDGINPQDL